MEISKTKKLAISALVLLIFIIGFWQLPKMMTSAEHISEEEAKSKVKDMYNGAIVEISELQKVYKVTFKIETGIYEVEIDRKTGDVGAIKRMKENVATNSEGLVAQENNKQPPTNNQIEQPAVEKAEQVKPESPTKPIEQSKPVEPTKPNEQPKPIEQVKPQQQAQPNSQASPPKQQVKQLTEQQAAAIALKNVSGEVDDIEIEALNGITYYLVEIERENGEDGTVQINAITGEVKSITWDD